MAVRLQYRRECDRCAHPFEDAIYSTPEEVPPRTGDRLTMQLNGELLFDWKDLCPSCVKAVHTLLDRLRLTSPPKKKELLTEPAPTPTAQPLSEYLAAATDENQTNHKNQTNQETGDKS